MCMETLNIETPYSHECGDPLVLEYEDYFFQDGILDLRSTAYRKSPFFNITTFSSLNKLTEVFTRILFCMKIFHNQYLEQLKF